MLVFNLKNVDPDKIIKRESTPAILSQVKRSFSDGVLTFFQTSLIRFELDDLNLNSSYTIGKPTNVERIMHVEIDKNNPLGFKAKNIFFK